MDQQRKQRIQETVRDFRMPRYHEIPDVGLFLEQSTKFITEALRPLGNITLTSSMISNYVKRGLIANPVKKQYDREQIAYLIFIAVTKNILSLEDIQLQINVQKTIYTPEKAYNYFCEELENVLHYSFGLIDRLEAVGVEKSDTKTMLRNTIIAVGHKVYLDKYFTELRREFGQQ